MIDLLRKCSVQESDRVLDILHSGRQETTVDQTEEVIQLAEHHGAMEYAEAVSEQMTSKALGHLEHIPASDARDRLRDMLEFFVQRAF